MTAERTTTTVACTVSRYKSICVVCSCDILPGERMFCTTAERRRRRPRSGIITATPPPPSEEEDDDDDDSASASASALAWGHEACHDPSLPPPPSCRHWERLGRCPALILGMCAFRHDLGDKGSFASTMDDKKMRWGGRRRYVRNRHKNSVFRIFLTNTYGIEYVNRHDGVILDVAGGKGELLFELLNLTGSGTCVVVDPRPLNLDLVRGKWKKGLYEPRRVGVFSRWYPACEEGCSDREPRNPVHIRCFFDGESFANFARACEREDVERTDEMYRLEIEKARRIAWTTSGLRHEKEEEDGKSSSSHDNNNEEEGEEEEVEMVVEGTEKIGNNDGIMIMHHRQSEILDPDEARKIVRRCHLVVGLHPDQAAGEIIEFALSMKIPYCIVPCCVYSDMFPKRKLNDGTTRVRTFDHLVEWLREKDPRARITTLDLEGKNTVVYSLPDI